MMNRLTWMGVGAALSLSVACAATGGSSEITSDDDGSGGAGMGPSTGGQGGTSAGGFNPTGGNGGGVTENYEVYGHGPTNLYRLDPAQANQVTLVGEMTTCGSGVIDIAIDKDNNIIGVTTTGIWNINRQTAVCTQIATGSFPNSLSFVPEGTLDPNVEALVGYREADYIQIDPTTGVESIVTMDALTGDLQSSGDVVSVDGGDAGNKTYLTVRGTGCDVVDCLVEINPVDGTIVQQYGSVGYKDVYGLAFWGGNAYGFSDGGDVFEITFNANNVTSTPITIPNEPPDLMFWGAGSSTLVPFEPPQ